MVTTAQLSQNDVGFVPVRALSSITPQQAEITAQTVHASGQAWHVQAFDDYDGYLSILIKPSSSDNEQEAFLISGTSQHLELFKIHDEDLLFSLASFSNASDLSDTLLDLIAADANRPACACSD